MFPPSPSDPTPLEFEQQVCDWLRMAGQGLKSFEVRHRRVLPGASGEYEFDAVATFEVLDGAVITVMVECKRVTRAIEREVLLALEAKRQEVGAHKLMVVATARFQSGAVTYAQAHGIATIYFMDGAVMYGTRSATSSPTHAATALALGLPRFVGWWVRTRSGTLIGYEDVRPLQRWIRAARRPSIGNVPRAIGRSSPQ